MIRPILKIPKNHVPIGKYLRISIWFVNGPLLKYSSQIPDEAWEAIDDFRVSLEIFDRGKLSLLLLRSLNPSEVASNNFLEIRSWPKVSPTSSSDMVCVVTAQTCGVFISS